MSLVGLSEQLGHAVRAYLGNSMLVRRAWVWVLAGGLVFEPDLVWCAAFVQHLGACGIGVVVPSSDEHHGAIWAQEKLLQDSSGTSLKPFVFLEVLY